MMRADTSTKPTSTVDINRVWTSKIEGFITVRTIPTPYKPNKPIRTDIV